ncbi:MAG TPA: DUF6263 family protein [Kofleriaceae bacterium]|nr:DUF6263 family protein [Kofleriaceae bacterium]
MRLRLFLCAVVLVGCSKGEDEGTPSIEPPDLQIVSAGSAPRQLLAYQPVQGSSVTLDLAVDVSVSAGEMGGPMPTIVLTLSVAVDAALPVGTMLRTTVVDAVARDRDDSRVPAVALGGPLGLMKGVVLTSMLTPSGRIVGTRVRTEQALPDTAKSQLSALVANFDQLVMPLPREPVGVGAVWRNSRPLEQNGMRMTAVNSIELLGVTEHKLSYAIDTEVHGPDQSVSQGGMTIDITGITGTGRGKGTIDLRTLAVSSELTSNFRSSMKATGEGQALPMQMTVTTHVTPR